MPNSHPCGVRQTGVPAISLRTPPGALWSVGTGGATADRNAGDRQSALSPRVPDQTGDAGDFETLLVQFDADVAVDRADRVGETELDTGTYECLQPDTDAIDATLGGSDPATAELPGGTSLKLDAEFEIRSEWTTTFVAAVTPGGQDQTGRYVLKPVADEVEVSNEDIRVVPTLPP